MNSISNWMAVFGSGIVCVDFSEISYPASVPTENNRETLSPVRVVAMKNILQIAHETGSTGLVPRKCHEENEVWHYWCNVWHHLVEARLNSLDCHVPPGKGQIHHSAD
jgi:hypothetical protein